MVSGEEAGPVPELPSRSRKQVKKNAIMEDRVFQELPDDFWDTPRARASYKVKLDDSDFESALLEQCAIHHVTYILMILILILSLPCENKKIIHQTLRKGESV